MRFGVIRQHQHAQRAAAEQVAWMRDRWPLLRPDQALLWIGQPLAAQPQWADVEDAYAAAWLALNPYGKITTR